MWQYVLPIIATVSALAATFPILSSIGKFIGNVLQEWLKARHLSKLNKEEAAYQTKLDKSLYVTKIQFDEEFLAYKEINKCCYRAYLTIHEFANVPVDGDLKKDPDYVIKIGERITDTVQKYQSKLLEYGIFMPEKIYDGYSTIRGKMVGFSYEVIDRLWKNQDQEIQNAFHDDDKDKADEILKCIEAINQVVRNRLSSLQIVES